uniref:DUF4378 domain-containing protein n=1 Tax=Physcomitrium patens TaxID=3218 RepID=A0A2K1K6S5_PHYPA|nr:uncharacterized protein LOC112285999 isoform X1 [Physcomitrium patens]PNR49483.1 hypothetical protein PHYPA_011379 [Physcomitrium patens]|eukprot:XP_024383235.1 uncharacterized protein LOC112285999 isoform X1 [Physcomitrella patens]
MTGLFQIFDRYRALARSKNVPKKAGPVSHGQAQPGGERDPSCINLAYHMFQDETGQRRVTLAGNHHLPQLEASRDPRRSSIDNSEVIVAKTLDTPKDIQLASEPKPHPPRTSLDSRPKPRLSLYLKDEASVNDTSAPSSAKDISVSIETPGDPLSRVHYPRSHSTAATPRSSVDGKVTGNDDRERKFRDLKGMLKGPFKRKVTKVNNQESPGTSFDSKESDQVKTVRELQPENKEDLNGLPKSGQIAPGGNEYKDCGIFPGIHTGWFEGREASTPRLTVELKDGPKLTRKDDQRVLNDDRLRVSEQKGSSVSLRFEEAPDVEGSKDLRKMGLGRNSIDGRESSRPPFDGKTVGSRLSVDGSRGSHQPSGMPRLSLISVVGREAHGQVTANNWFAQNIHTSLEASTPVFRREENAWCDSPGRWIASTWDGDFDDSKWKASSVVARLMGLEDLPNFDVVSNAESATEMSPEEQCSSPQTGPYYMEPDESPSRDDEDSYQVFGTDEVVTPLRKDTPSKFMPGVPLVLPARQLAISVSTAPRLQLGYCKSPDSRGQQTPASPKYSAVSPKHHMIESLPQVLKHQVELKISSEGLLYSDMDQRLRQLGLKNTIQERKTLKQILEAMHQKGLLQPPPHVNPEWKRNLPRHSSNSGAAKSSFLNRKDRSSSQALDSFNDDLFGLDYKDIPMYVSAKMAKGPAEGGHVSDSCKSPLRGRTGEASIVVMKPLNSNSASKLILAKPSLEVDLEKEQETVIARVTNAPTSLSTLATPVATLTKDGSSVMNIRHSSKNETSAASRKLKLSSKSDDSRSQSAMEEVSISVKHRRERIAAQTAKFKSESGDLQQHDSPKSTRSLSPSGRKSAKTGSSIRSAFGSSLSQSGKAKSRARPVEKKDVKSTTQTTRRAKHSQEQLKEGSTTKQEHRRAPRRITSDRKWVAGNNTENIPALEQFRNSKSAGEVAVLRSKRTETGGSNDQFSSATPADVDTKGRRVMNFDKYQLAQLCSEFVESTADSCSESQDITLERSLNGSPINVTSPTLTVFESRRLSSRRHSLEKLPDDFYDAKERYESKLEDSELETYSDVALYTDLDSSDVPMSREAQIQEPESSALDSLEPSSPGFQEWREGREGGNGQMAKYIEQPSPISVLKNINFQKEEFTPSPKFEKSGFISARDCCAFESGEEQEDLKKPIWQPTDLSTPAHQIPVFSGDPLKDLMHKVARSLNLDDQNSFLNKPTLEIQVPYVSDLFSPSSLNSVPPSFFSKEDEKAYVKHIMVASGVTEECTAPKEWSKYGSLMKADLFDQLEEHLELRESARKQNAYLSGEERTEYLKQALDRRLLFDCVNSILERKWHSYFHPHPWGAQTFRKKPIGVKLVEEIWEELESLRSCALDDDSLYGILQMDFTQRAEKWVDFSLEVGEISTEIQEMILDELVNAAVQEWSDESKFH